MDRTPPPPPPPQLPPSNGPARGAATASAAANAALLAAALAAPQGGDRVTRSASAESHDSRATSLGGRSSAAGGGGSLGGSVGGSAASGPGDAFGAGSAPPFPAGPATAVPPPPWPTAGAPPQQQQQPLHPQPMAAPQHPPPPQQQQQQPPPPLPQQQQLPPTLSLSLMTRSADTLFSVPSGASAGAATPSSSANVTLNSSASTAPQHSHAAAPHAADSSVLLGLEELERQQAHAEERRAEQLRAEQRQQRPPPGGGATAGAPPLGLPPLAPLPPRPASAPSTGSGALPAAEGRGGVPSDTGAVPSQIHLVDGQDGRDEDTILSHDGGGGAQRGHAGGGGKDMKRVVSIEKMRGSVSVSLRRFRSWSQDARARASAADSTPNTPVANSSVDSTQNSGSGMGEGGQPHQPQQPPSPLKSAGKKLEPGFNNTISEPYLDHDESKPLIYGYLRKFGRNGHWQKRFFETNGERLTYYKSVKRTKALATLDLCQVGEISIDKPDPEECTFTIAVKNRPYYLRAEDKAQCNDWVIILNRAREARMHVGNLQLAGAGGEGRAAHRSQAGGGDYAPCIVISALRPRTRAVMDFEGGGDLRPMEEEAEGAGSGDSIPDLLTSNTAMEQEQFEVMAWDDRHEQHLQEVVSVVGGPLFSPLPAGVQSHAKWVKRHSYMHVLSLRFLKWARSITHTADACRREAGSMVVPAHVVMAAQQAAQQTTPVATQGGGGGAPAPEAAAAPPAAGGNPPVLQQQQGTEGARNRTASGGLPSLLEEAPPLGTIAPSAAEDNNDESLNNRSRASTESSAFGSTYV